MWLPPFKYTKGLYADEGNFTTADGKPFSGPYYKTHDGKIFSGNGPSKDQQELIPDLDYLGSTDRFFDDHGELVQPSSDIIYPTPNDYKKGYFLRYFIRDNRENKLVEASKEMYNRYKTELYMTGAEVKWILDKPVKDIFNQGYLYKGAATRNRENILQASQTMPELREYIRDYGEFANIESDVEGYEFRDLPKEDQQRIINNLKPSIQEEPIRKRKPRFKQIRKSKAKIRENLYTSGGRFKVEGSNEEYKGFYHIHPTVGPMVGAVHTATFHKKLVPYLLAYETERQSTTSRTSTTTNTTNGNTSSSTSTPPSSGNIGYY